MANEKLIKIIGLKYGDLELEKVLHSFDAPIIFRNNPIEEFGGGFISFKEFGISFYFDEFKTLCGIFLYSEGKEGFRQYAEQLPLELSFSFTKKEVIKRLGKPAVQKKGYLTTVLGKVPDWIRYDYQNFSLHCQFAYKGNISRITITVPEVTPKVE